jgi:hypothetical protein
MIIAKIYKKVEVFFIFDSLMNMPANETVEKLRFRSTFPGQRAMERPDPRFEGG